MSKIVEAINTMVKNNRLIEDVAILSDYNNDKSQNKYFFKYKSYIWSIKDLDLEDNDFELIYYPGHNFVSDVLSEIRKPGLNDEGYVKYLSSDIKTREATESFTDLYRIVKEKLYNVDKVLDDIIGDM